MLESILVKNVATYDNTGIEISGLKKINFIYGANGSGKTTVTKVIGKIKDEPFKNCSLIWRGGLAVKALIYNKDFREANFGKGNIDGVFTLGQATKKEIEAIDVMQKMLEEIKEKGIKKKDELEKLIKDRDDYINEYKEAAWVDVYKEYENDFKEAFKGVMQKESFKTKLLEEFKNNNAVLKKYEELKEKASTIFGTPPKSLTLITAPSFERILTIEKDKIWKKKIIGKADVEIAKLIQKLNLNDWVNEGRSFIQDDETCPFCQQKTITRTFKKQLEDYFDETYTSDIGLVKSLADEYNQLSSNLVNILNEIERTEKINSETKLITESFSAFLKTLESQFISNKELLNNKIKEPSRAVELVSVNEQLKQIRELILNANNSIKSHNQIVANYTKEKAELIKEVWKFLCEKNKSKIQSFNSKFDGLQKGIENLTKKKQELGNEYTELNKKIRNANKNVTSVQPSVDEINKILKSYGFTNFEIIASKAAPNQYQIQREDGTIAEATLSEGEVTFITFLYFLQLAKGSTSQETITEERILIIDDPISSLDSNILFVVSSLLKQIIKSIKKSEGSIKQLVLFTHNVYFHKEVSFIDGRTKENTDTHYWILRRNSKVSEIQFFGIRNPIHSSYSLLWEELKSKSNSGITTQNIMRRIIENYFKILGKYGDDELIESFQSLPEQEICRSLICWINDGSHGIPDDLYIEHQETTIEKYFEVFKKIFTNMGHPEHYSMMMGEIEPKNIAIAS